MSSNDHITQLSMVTSYEDSIMDNDRPMDAAQPIDSSGGSSSVVAELEKQLLNVELQQKIFIRSLIRQLEDFKRIQNKLGLNGLTSLPQHEQQETGNRQSAAETVDQPDGLAAKSVRLTQENRKLMDRLAQMETNEESLRREIKRMEEKHVEKSRRQREMTNATKLRQMELLATNTQSDEIKQIVTELHMEVSSYNTNPPTCNIGQHK